MDGSSCIGRYINTSTAPNGIVNSAGSIQEIWPKPPMNRTLNGSNRKKADPWVARIGERPESIGSIYRDLKIRRCLPVAHRRQQATGTTYFQASAALFGSESTH